MYKGLRIFLFLFAATMIPLSVADASDIDKAVNARQAVMKLRVFYIGQLGAMAKGKVAYDANKAQRAADSLLALANLDGSAMWPPGSGNDKLGDKTRALPAIWGPKSDIGSKAKALGAAVAELAKSAGSGIEGLRGSIGPVGKSCGGCHKPYRAEKK
jgi:cytochrome c556